MTLQRDPERNESKYLHSFADFTNKRVLEVGCGEGRLTWQYANRARSTIGVDLDTDALRVAIFDRPSGLESKVHFSVARSEQLPFSSGMFDIAIFAWSF
jgi:ubiquinone/menaquinone biosynthesis C-methylase UbiE